MTKEVWKDIPFYEGYYQASNFGRIKSLDRSVCKKYDNDTRDNFINGLIIKPYLNEYLYVQLSKNGSIKNKLVHRLVASALIENNENKEQINHINGNKEDNNINNLEWCTRSENMIHAYKILGYENQRRKRVRSLDLGIETDSMIEMGKILHKKGYTK